LLLSAREFVGIPIQVEADLELRNQFLHPFTALAALIPWIFSGYSMLSIARHHGNSASR